MFQLHVFISLKLSINYTEQVRLRERDISIRYHIKTSEYITYNVNINSIQTLLLFQIRLN